MKSHDLASLLLSLENLDVATHANNHTAFDGGGEDSRTIVARLETYRGPRIVIGNLHRRATNYPNDWVSDVFGGARLPNDHWDGRGAFPVYYAGPTKGVQR